MTLAEVQDLYYRALCIWREMRGESEQARLGCYWAITNRSTDMLNRWPKTLYGVVTQPMQFSSFNPTDPNSSKMPSIRNTADWQAWNEICSMCDNPGEDPTQGANQYEALPDGAQRPPWAMQSRMTVQIGRTRFYKL